MRIIAGKAKGHSLNVPRDVSRPTTERVRESVFGTLMGRLEGARVLDLYAGSGALGLEALSRGASSCDFVEKDRAAAKTLKGNLEKSKLPAGTIHHREVADFLKNCAGGYDLIFADPPYTNAFGDIAAELVSMEGWQKWLAPEGLLTVEREARGEVPLAVGLELLRERDYGRSRIIIYQRAS
ncbi:MAG: 16S rRNA (guanine(966)-N(2))-methyltransferase RsmD [Akkermansiaceae bacterium]|jgi:16S rRNA (guanine966-N2)-methyltransferase